MPHFLRKFLFLTIFLTFQLVSAQVNYADPSHLDQIVQVSMKLKNICPETKCLFIGLGGSPTIFTEVLGVMKNTSSLHLPLSSFRYSPENGPYLGSLSNKLKQKLFNHFDNIFSIEGAQLTSFNNIVIFDFAWTGRSIASASHYLNIYLKENGRHIKITPVLLGEKNTQQIEFQGRSQRSITSHNAYYETWLEVLSSEFSLENIQLINTKDYPLVHSSLVNQRYDDYRKYKGYYLLQKPKLRLWGRQYSIKRKYKNMKKKLIKELLDKRSQYRQSQKTSHIDMNLNFKDYCSSLFQ